MAGPEAITRARVDNGRLRGDLRKTRGIFSKTFGKIGRGIKKTLGGALSPLGIGAGALGLGIIGKQVLDFETTLVRLQNQADLTPEALGKLRRTITDLSKATGIGRDEILGAANNIVNLGGAAAFSEEKIQALSRVSIATGATMEDLSRVQFALDRSFFDSKASAVDLEEALAILTAAGKDGSITLEQMGGILQTSAPAFKAFGIEGNEATKQLGAFLQVAAKLGEFGTPEEVATGFSGFVTALKKNRKRIESELGVEVFTVGAGGLETLRLPLEILEEISKSKKALKGGAVASAFGNKNAIRFVEALGTAQGFKLFAQSMEQAGGAMKEMRQDGENFQNSTAGRLKQSFNDMQLSLTKAFTPERIESFANAMETVAGVVEIMVDHAEIFIALWAAFKITTLVLGFKAIAASSAATAATSAATTGALGKAGNLLGSFAFGVAFGTQLDKLFGLSDIFGNLAIGAKDEADIETGFIKDRAADFDFESRAQQALRGGDLTRKEELSGTSLLNEARRSGLVKDGKVNRAKAFQTAEGGAGGGVGIAARSGGDAFVDTEKTRQLTAALDRALELEKAGKLQTVEVVVRVDPKSGKISADETSESKSRRNTQ